MFNLDPMRLFVTGTDTDVGKTVATIALMQALASAGHRVAGFKPVAAGGIPVSDESVVAQPNEFSMSNKNEDALLIQKHSSCAQSYQSVNPIFFSEAIAPHIAAINEGRQLTAAECAGKVFQEIETLNLSGSRVFSVIEGAGGWRVPLNDKECFSDLAVRLNVGVILVVGVRLGCLNHAALTVEVIERDGLPLLGWIANCYDPNAPYIEENILTLEKRIDAPMIARIPYLSKISSSMLSDSASSLGSYVDVKKLADRISMFL